MGVVTGRDLRFECLDMRPFINPTLRYVNITVFVLLNTLDETQREHNKGALDNIPEGP